MSATAATGHWEVRQRTPESEPVLYVRVRRADGSQVRRRVGTGPAHVEPAPGQKPPWKPKRGRTPMGYSTIDDAIAMKRAILAGEDDSVRIAPVTLTWGALCDAWLATREIELSTYSDYSNAVKARIKPMLGPDTPVDEITVNVLGRFRDDLLAEGLAPRTVSKYLALIHSVFRYGAEAHGLNFNPAANVRRPKQRRSGLDQYLTPEEVGVLVRAADTDEEAVLYEVACWTGLRFGELRALRWGDIDWLGSQLQVLRNWPVKGREKLPKSGRARAVPLWDQAAQALERLSHRGHQTGPDDRVFIDPRGDQVLDYDAVAQRRFKATRDRAGLTSPRPGPDELTFHDLRHSYGTVAARIYGDLRDVQRFMGHASITTTEIYAHFLPRLDDAQRGSAGLAALLAEAEVLA